ncbi:MAG: 4Fe-4S binding protein [Synergistaceae bacterium]|nr:4Fe-4S binding protein [Synergistaceae bacterium]
MPAIDYASLKKGGFMRQRPVEYFSLRLGITGGHVTAEQLAVITEVSKKYGRGWIHLTSRQGIEIPYIEYDDIDAVKEELSRGGVFPGASGPRVRTITACQGNAVCGNACIDTQSIACILHERYYGQDLPHKFKMGVTGCPNNCLKAEENDLGIKGGIRPEWIGEGCVHCGKCAKSCRRGAITDADGKIIVDRDKCVSCGKCARVCPAGAFEAQEGYCVYFGGLFGNTINRGEALLPFITDREALLRVCDAAISFFRENAQPGERFKFTIDRVGIDALRSKLTEALEENSPA